MTSRLVVLFVALGSGAVIGRLSAGMPRGRASTVALTSSLVRPDRAWPESVTDRLHEAVPDGPDSLDPNVEPLAVSSPQPLPTSL